MLWFLTKAVPPGHEERSDIVDLNVENKGWVDTTITVQTTQPYSGGHLNGEGVELKVIVVPAQGSVDVFNVYPSSLPPQEG